MQEQVLQTNTKEIIISFLILSHQRMKTFMGWEAEPWKGEM
ncbi:hypothetical protein [Rufibacter tibetensis]|nr:hypothetical protein [Rufibacter tibetensis]